jgi:WD40 repeat protein
MFVLLADRSFSSIAFPKNFKAGFVPEITQLDSLAKFFRTSDVGQCVQMGEPHRFISSSTVDDTFHIFRVDGSSISHTLSVRHGSSLLATLTCAGPNALLTSWRDSSLTLWNLVESRACVQRYRQSPHLTSVVGVDLSPVLRLIASLDKNRRCVLSFLRNGQFTRQFIVEGKSSEESFIKVMLLGGGYVVFLSSVKTAGGVTTVLRLYGINGRKIAEFSLPDALVDCCKFETELAVSAVALSFSGGRFVLLGMPDGRVMLDVQTDKKLGLLQFVPQFGGFLAASAENEICFITLE